MSKKVLKFKALSLLIISAMIASILQVPAFAAWTDDTLDTSNTKGFFVSALEAANFPTITTVLLDNDFNEITLESGKRPAAGSTVYIGLKAKNFSKYAKNNKGAFLVSTSMVFDKRYLSLDYTTDGRYRTGLTGNLEKLGNKCYYNILENNGEELLGGYSIASSASIRSATMTDDDTAITLLGATAADTTNLQKATSTINYTPDDVTNEDEPAAVIEDNSYIAVYQFKVNDTLPDGSSLGVAMSRSGSIGLTLGNGSSAFSKSFAQTDGLHKYIVLEDGVNLFPGKKTVDHVGAEQKGTATIADQYVNGTLTKEAIEAAYSIKEYYNSAGTDKDDAQGTITYKVAASSGITDPTSADLKDLGTAWTATGTQYIYALVNYGTTDTPDYKMCPVGSGITINADGIKTISGTVMPKTINSKLTVGNAVQIDSITNGRVTYNSGKTTDTTFTLDTLPAGFAIYYATGANAPAAFASYTQLTDPKTQTTVKYTADKIHFIISNADGSIKSAASSFSTQAAGADTYALTGSISKKDATKDTYPDVKVNLSALRVHITNANTGKDETKTLAEANAKVYVTVNGVETEITEDTVITPAMGGATVIVKANNGTTTVPNTTVKLPTVNKKELTVSFTGTPAARDYNGAADKTVPAGITPSVTTVNGDAAITVPAITYSYADGNKGDNKAITAAWTTNAGTFDNYTLALPTGGATGITGNITAKDLNPTLVVTVSQNNAQVGDYTLADAAATISSSDKLTADTVNVTVSGTISEADIKAGGNGKTVNNPQYKVDNANYVIGTATVTANVTNLPVANDLDADTKAKLANQTMKASDANNTEDYLITKLANLPTTGQSNIAGNDGKVNIAWTVDKVYTAKGTKYTYTGKVTAADPSKITANISDITVEVTVDAVNITPVTVQPITAKLGDTAPTLPTSGTTTGDVAVPYRITWVDGEGNPVTELKTDAILNATYTGTVTYYLTGKEWATEPTDKTVTLVYTVNDKDKTVINSVEAAAEVKVNAADPKNTETDIASLLPATVKAKDANGNDVELAVTWATTDTYNIKGGEYTYTATFTDEVLADYDVSAITEPITVKLNVAPVTSKVADGIFDALTVSRNRDNSAWDKLGMPVDGTLTLEPAVEGVEVKYTIEWSPASTTLDTSKAGNSVNFTGKIKIADDAPAWLTQPETATLTGTKTVKVQAAEISSGRGSASRSTTYAVTFSAGAHGTIVSGKRSITVTKDKVVTELPVVEAKEGYKFLGWSQDGGKTVINVEETPIIKTTTLTAVYEEIVEETPAPTATPLVNAKYTKPYASGYDGDVFLPENNITRAELATMIARLINGDDIADGSYRASFSDIPADAWYSKYVGYLESFGVLDGYEEDGIMVFKPEQTITRAEMAAVITRAQKYAVDNSDSTFWDVANDYWAKDYITTLAGKGIITGYADGSFGAVSPLTRAEAVVIINRLLDPSTAIVTFEPVDISGHWAEQEIILAVNERQVNGTEVEATPEPEETPAPEATPEATAEPEADATAEPTATPAA